MLQWEDDSSIMGLKGYPKGWVMEVQLEEDGICGLEHGEKTGLGYLAFTETISPCVPEPLLLDMGIEKGLGVKAPVLPLRKSAHPGRTPGPPFVIQQSSTSSSAKGSALHSILRTLLWMAFHLAANYRLSCNRSPVILFNCRVA